MNQGAEQRVPSMLALLASIRRIVKLGSHPVGDPLQRSMAFINSKSLAVVSQLRMVICL
jgi:hypothetical protein